MLQYDKQKTKLNSEMISEMSNSLKELIHFLKIFLVIKIVSEKN